MTSLEPPELLLLPGGFVCPACPSSTTNSPSTCRNADAHLVKQFMTDTWMRVGQFTMSPHYSFCAWSPKNVIWKAWPNGLSREKSFTPPPIYPNAFLLVALCVLRPCGLRSARLVARADGDHPSMLPLNFDHFRFCVKSTSKV